MGSSISHDRLLLPFFKPSGGKSKCFLCVCCLFYFFDSMCLDGQKCLGHKLFRCLLPEGRSRPSSRAGDFALSNILPKSNHGSTWAGTVFSSTGLVNDWSTCELRCCAASELLEQHLMLTLSQENSLEAQQKLPVLAPHRPSGSGTSNPPSLVCRRSS